MSVEKGWILLKSTEEVYHLLSHAWGSKDSAGIVTRCGINDLTLEIDGHELSPTATRCVRCFGHGA